MCAMWILARLFPLQRTDIPVNTMIYSVVNSLLDTTSADRKCKFQSKVIQRLS